VNEHPSFIDQPELALDKNDSRIEVRTYVPVNSVDIRVKLATVWPTVLEWTLSLTAQQAKDFAERILAAATVIDVTDAPVEEVATATVRDLVDDLPF
jgi:hypothetical protein